MTVDRIAALAGYTDDELLAEIQRRRDEAQRRLDRLSAVTSGTGPRFAKKSDAKRAYWAEFRTWLASHPGGSVEQWKKARKRAGK